MTLQSRLTVNVNNFPRLTWQEQKLYESQHHFLNLTGFSKNLNFLLK
jgi:hypothetical protein